MQPIQFDPRLSEFRADPYPVYDMLRESAPIFFWEEWGIWFLTRYEDCFLLLRDDRLGRPPSSPPTLGGTRGGAPKRSAWENPLAEIQENWMLFKNPPDHTRLRALLHKAFTPRMVERQRETIQTITNGLLDQVQEVGQMDLMAQFASRLPVMVIAEMLGVPIQDHEEFRAWSTAIGGSLDLTEESEVYDQAKEAAALSILYFKALAEERRLKPQDDLLSVLVAVEEAGDKLSEEELIGTITLLFFAGHETTVNLIGNGILALLQNPAQMERLKGQPTLINSAVEELLRYDSAVQMTSRVALEDITWNGHTFHQGQQVSFLLGAANRDPAIFANPNTLDITRHPNRHLAFSSGIHYCLGAPLARLEGQIAINTLLQRMPNLTLATETPHYRNNYTLRGLTALPVLW